MSKFAAKAALIVGAVALAATGFGAVASAGILGAGLTVSAATAATAATLATVSTIATIASVAAGGLSLVSALTAKKPEGTAGGSQTEFSADPNAGVPYLVGRTGTAGDIIFRRASDGWSKDTPNDLQDLITVFSGAGPIDAFESFTSDKGAITFDGAGNAVGAFRDKMFQRVQRGLCPEGSALTVQAGSSAGPTGWTTAHKLSGMAAAIWRLRYDSKQRYFQNGVPAPMWIIRGVLTYDPRLDSTYPGGSGPHRHDNEATWTWSENPYLHALTWCIGRHQNGKRVMGLGAKIDSIIVADFVEGANIADANGWKLGGVVYSRPDTKWNVLKQMLQAGAGEPLKTGARIGCLVNAPRVSLATITEADIIGDAKLAAMQPIRSRVNTVIPRYRSEAHEWEIVPAAPIRVPAHIAEDGDERSKEITYSLVQDVEQAATLARYDIENTREFGPGTFPLLPKWINYKGGDCVTIQRGDLAPIKVLILRRTIEPSTPKVTFEVRSETDGKHAFALGQTTTPPPTASVGAYDPSVAAPAETDWTVSGVTLSANGVSIPAIVAVGLVAMATADAVIFDYRPYVAGTGPQDGWIGAGIDSPTINRKEITGVTPGTQYEVSIRYRVRGVIGDRRILGPATAGAFGAARAAYQIIRQSIAYPVTSTATTIAIQAFDATIDDGRVLHFPAQTIAGLAAASIYIILWDLNVATFVAVSAPALNEVASSRYVVVREYTTQSADGTYPATPTVPGGDGGGGYGGGGCPVPEAWVLLADDQQAGPGRTIAMGELRAGMHVWSAHEHTGQWGAWEVERTWRFLSPLYEQAGRPITSPSHLWAIDPASPLAGWQRMDVNGTARGSGEVIGVTVRDAHTYVLVAADGTHLLSHNKRTSPDDP